ncbi:MAG: hypothetical protein HRU18_01360 [Pseudoalteromonas sp.]|uniref:hypothetical protein n=1 Tax=Pseudoalteromonas sp. TaxID=53249 RepID=UPI001D912582|nr:hypothetical protein [Pseudoalteromonas sp.]NRA76828.1 hypothetical protein [Pseudoalteromonas sp.]
MKLKTNLFERITQHFYEDGGDIHWWIDEEDEADFLETFSDAVEDGSLKKTDTRVINGKQWNEWWIGGVYGDYEGKIVNEECPKCGHVLVDPEMDYDKNDEPVIDARFCSNHDCDYVNESFKKASDANDKYWEDLRNKPPEKQIRVAGETVFEFVERVGLSLDKRSGVKKCKDYYWMPCSICGQTIPNSDFYIGQDTGFATVFFGHTCEDGKNVNYPSVGTPFKKEAKEKWYGVLGR